MASEGEDVPIPSMKLKIISNAEEVGTHMFDNIPVDTTIGWIKTHLQAILPTHPPAESQRILYQARFLEDDNATLASIFGTSTPDEKAFHLVLRAPRASRLNVDAPEPRTASAPPGPAQAHLPPTLQPHTFGLQPGVRPFGMNAEVPLHQHPGHTHMTIHTTIAQQHHLQHLQAHQRALEMMQQQRRDQEHHNSTPEQQQATAGQGLQGATRLPPSNVPHPSTFPNHFNPRNAIGGAHPTGHVARGAMPGGFAPHLPPHLASLQHLQQNQHVPGVLAPQGPLLGAYIQNARIDFPPAVQTGASARLNPSSQGDDTAGNVSQNVSDLIQQMQQQLEILQRRAQELFARQQSFRAQTPPEIDLRLEELRTSYLGLTEGLRRSQSSLDTMASEQSVRDHPNFLELRTSVENLLLQVRAAELSMAQTWASRLSRGPRIYTSASHQPSITAVFPPIPANSQPVVSQSSPVPGTSPRLMLLRNPSGEPHALLVGPSGTYRTPELPQDLLQSIFQQSRPPVGRNDTWSRLVRQVLDPGDPQQAPTQPQVNGPGRQALPLDQLRPNNAQQIQNIQAEIDRLHARRRETAQERNAVVRNVIRHILMAVWLGIRIAGMLYLFGGISADTWFSWRPFAITALILAGWAAQQPWARRHIDAIRVHFEQLFGVQLQIGGRGGIRANAPRPAAPAEEAQAPGQPEQAPPEEWAEPQATQAAADPTQQPQRGAERLSLREQLRGVERAVALFAASLVPGMGEGIVQARQTAEADARRAVEEAERARDEAARAAEGEEAGQLGDTEDAQGSASVAPVEATDASLSTEASAAESGARAASTQVDVQGTSSGSEIRRVNKDKDTAEQTDGPETLPSAAGYEQAQHQAQHQALD